MRLARVCLLVFAVFVVCSVWVYTQTQNVIPKYGPSGALVNSSIVDVSSNIGIGTTAPAVKLDVADGSAIRIGAAYVGAGLAQYSMATFAANVYYNGTGWVIPDSAHTSQMMQSYAGGLYFLNTHTNGGTDWSYNMTMNANGTIGIGTYGANQNAQLAVNLNAGAPGLNASYAATFMGGNVGIGTTSPSSKLHVAGNVTVDGNIGAKYQDVAEWVDGDDSLPAGTVVTADPERPNHVRSSDRPYDTSVAGVISKQPGILLGEAGRGKVAVAQSGRVRVMVDASYGAIKPGDLLVTSPTPGFAMRSEPVTVGDVQFHLPGTILGKALEPLREGQGEVLALVTLQ